MFTDFLYRHLQTHHTCAVALLEKEKDTSVQRAIEQAQELVQVHHTTSTQETEQSDEEETQTPHRVS